MASIAGATAAKIGAMTAGTDATTVTTDADQCR